MKVPLKEVEEARVGPDFLLRQLMGLLLDVIILRHHWAILRCLGRS